MGRLFNLRGKSLRLLVTIVCGCAFSLFGYDQALYGGVASGEAFLKQFNNPSPELTGQTAALYDIGCLIGAICASIIAQKLGYKRSLLLGSAIIVVGATIQSVSVNIGMLIAGRIIGGIGNGINTSCSPVYHAETSQSHSRGRAVIGELFILDVGWLIAQFVTFGFSYVSGGMQWIFPTACQIVFLIPVFALLPFLPESPRWLASGGRFEQAEDALCMLTGEDKTSNHFKAQFEDIREVVRLEHAAEQTKFSDLWNGKGQNLYRAILACAVQLMAQIGGINIIAYYVVIIFESQLGLGSQLARILAACCGFGWLFSNLTSMVFIEKWGRRKLLIIGGIGQAICFLVSGIALATGGSAKWAGIVVVIMIYLFFIIFAFAWQAIPFLYPAEIVSLKYRARFYPIANGCNWAINYAVVLVTPVGLANIGWKFYIVFGIFNLANALIVWFFFVETARKTLEEVDMLFLGEHGMGEKSEPPFLRLRGKKTAIQTSEEEKTSEVSEGNQGKNVAVSAHSHVERAED